jgi:subtilisin family serine protease
MNHLRPFVLLVLLWAVSPIAAQQRVKMCFELMNWLKDAGADEQVDLFIHGPSEAVGEAVRMHGGLVKMALPRLVNARVPVATIHALAASDAVERFEFGNTQVYLLNDSARVKSGFDRIHTGEAPLPAAYQGEGVIMGIIDTGLDVLHGDFLREDGTTRVVKYWDQTLANGPFTPAQYGYGQAWTAQQINAGSMTSVDANGHGTSVTGIAVGGGTANGMHKGMAPKADLMVVKYSSTNFASKVADAVHFIFTEAAALGKPAVVNISLGRQMGSHDGLDAAALFIDALLDTPGRVVVAAAGNFDNWDPYHLRTQVTADTSFTWFQYNANTNFGGGLIGGVYFEAWADAPDLANVQFAIGADRVVPGYQYRGRTPFRVPALQTGTVFTDTLYSLSGNRLAVVNMLALPRGAQVQLMVQLIQPDSSSYRFRLMSTGSGKFDVWSNRSSGWSQMVPNYFTYQEVNLVPTVAEYPPVANYVFPDNNGHITDNWTCSPRVITVANYRNETAYTSFTGSWEEMGGTEGQINITSSRGPTRDDRMKPEIAAPGDIVFGSYPLQLLQWMQVNEPFKLAVGGLHIRGGGTSAASPHVAGAAALYLQKCPMATYAEVREALFSTAMADEFTEAVPNMRWGHGKLNAFAALNTSNQENFTLLVTGDVPFCPGDAVTVSGPTGFADYAWSSGETGSSDLQYGDAGPLSLIAYTGSRCQAYSDTVTFSLWPAPPQPSISLAGFMLTSTVADSYQWLLNGEVLEGFTSQSIEAPAAGLYQVMITGDHGCTSVSEPVQVISTAVAEAGSQLPLLWPSPANDLVHVRLAPGTGIRFRVIDAEGRVVLERNSGGAEIQTINVSGWAAGTYFLRVEQGDAPATLHRFVKLP